MPGAAKLKLSLQKLGQTLRDLPKPTATAVSAKNAAAWNAPGGGYEQWKKGDPAREKAMPIGMPVVSPGNLQPLPMAQPNSYLRGGMVRKTGMALVHRGEKIMPLRQKSRYLARKLGRK